MDESLEQMQARHRKEQKELQGRITNKKKNSTKKTRKGVNDECVQMELDLKERQAAERQRLNVEGGDQPGVVAGLADVDDTGNIGGGDDDNDNDKHRTDEPNGLADLGSGSGSGSSARDTVNGVAHKLKETSLSAADAIAHPQQHQQHQQTKKRNRAKERLARRAAEQEAEAEAAQAEAAGMVDRRGLEAGYMREQCRAHGLEEKDIAPDGHCLFAAVADQLAQRGVALTPGAATPEKERVVREDGFRIARRVAAAHMAERRDDFAPFVEEDFDGYVKKIRDTAEWGGQLELQALATVYGVEICVVHEGRTEVIKPGGDGQGREIIWLAFYRHGYGLGEHYNSLRKAP